jgi:hypothetical protein
MTLKGTARPTGAPLWARSATIGHYGGSADKEDCATEEEPYAYTWYSEYTEMLPDSLTESRTGLVHARKLAKARLQASVTRSVERAINNIFPDTADEKLDEWIRLLEVPLGEDRHLTRQRCAAKYQAQRGATSEVIDEVLTAALGDKFVRVIRQRSEDLSVETENTFWVGGDAGPTSFDLGNGTWLSDRSHLGVLVQRPPDSEQSEFYQEMSEVVFATLNPLLPAHCTFDWTTSAGFLLDISQLDFDGLGD